MTSKASSPNGLNGKLWNASTLRYMVSATHSGSRNVTAQMNKASDLPVNLVLVNARARPSNLEIVAYQMNWASFGEVTMKLQEATS